MRFIGWIIRIFQGWWNWAFKKPDEEVKRRKKICDNCEYARHGICTVCGCVLKAKQFSPDEKCLMNKWE